MKRPDTAALSPAYRWKTKKPKPERSDPLSLAFTKQPGASLISSLLPISPASSGCRSLGAEHVSHDHVADGYSLVNGEINEGPGIEVNAWNEDNRHHDTEGGAGGSCLPPCLS